MTLTTRYAPRGVLALEPNAYNMALEPRPADPQSPPTLAMVAVRGPLITHRANPWAYPPGCAPDSYEDIKCRLTWAAESDALAIVMPFDSPGGAVSGLFELCAFIKQLSTKSGKPIMAYAEGSCCSAAYALAISCTMLFSSPAAIIGSIGCVEGMLDATIADAKQGLAYVMIASGKHKTDGNPHTPVTDSSVSAYQRRVDDLAAMFFNLVGDSRPISSDEAKSLEADTFTGERAKALRLVDDVMTLDALVSSLLSNPKGPSLMAGKSSAVLSALVAAMGGDDPQEAAKAKKAMAAICAEDSEGEEGEEKKPDAKAESEDDSEPPKKKEEGADAAATPPAVAAQAPAVAPAMTAAAPAPVVAAVPGQVDAKELELRRFRKAERARLIAARPDLTEAQLAVFRNPQLVPLASLPAMLAAVPVPVGVTPAAALAAAQSAQPPTQGASVRGAARLPVQAVTDAQREMNERMGITASANKPQIFHQDHKHVFSVVTESHRETAAATAQKEAEE